MPIGSWTIRCCFTGKESYSPCCLLTRQAQKSISHGGLTYGGIISDSPMKVPVMLEVFEAMCHYLKSRVSRKLLYKAIPHIYHRLPAEEDLYALFR